MSDQLSINQQIAMELNHIKEITTKIQALSRYPHKFRVLLSGQITKAYNPLPIKNGKAFEYMFVSLKGRWADKVLWGSDIKGKLYDTEIEAVQAGIDRSNERIVDCQKQVVALKKQIYKELVKQSELNKQLPKNYHCVGELVLSEDHWDCSCSERYIHRKTDRTHCPKCKAENMDQPDSRVNEILPVNLYKEN